MLIFVDTASINLFELSLGKIPESTPNPVSSRQTSSDVRESDFNKLSAKFDKHIEAQSNQSNSDSSSEEDSLPPPDKEDIPVELLEAIAE